MVAEVQMRFFKADEDFTAALTAEYKTQSGTSEPIKKSIHEKYGSDSMLHYGTGRAGGIAFRINDRSEATERRGMIMETQKEGEQWYAVYKPNKRFKEGKELSADLAKYNKALDEDPSFNDWATKKLGIYQDCVGPSSASRTGMALFRTTAGVAQGIFVAKVPTKGEEQADLPGLPPELIEIKKSEFIALTEE